MIFFLLLVCFKIFDTDQDGELNEEEIRGMASGLLSIQNSNNNDSGVDKLKRLAGEVENMKNVLIRISQHTQKQVEYITVLHIFTMPGILPSLPGGKSNSRFSPIHI